MAINLIEQPGATTPVYNTDYTQQNILINGALAQSDEILTDWASTSAAPSIKQGTYIYHSGNLYSVDSSDEAISGTPASGVNYIGLTSSGTVLTAAYVTDISGYTYNPAYAGLYNGSILIIKAIVYLSGSVYNRGLSADRNMSGVFLLADGSEISSRFDDSDNLTCTSVSATTVSASGKVSSGGFTLGTSWSSGTFTVSTGGSYTLAAGIWTFGAAIDVGSYIVVDGSTTGGADTFSGNCTIISDGTTYISNALGANQVIRYNRLLA